MRPRHQRKNIGRLVVLVLFLFLAGCEHATKNERIVKTAFAAYDTKYGDDDLKYLATHVDLLIVHESLKDKLGALRENNTKLLILLYKFSGMTKSDTIGHSASGYEEIFSSHQDWFLRNKFGDAVADDYNNYSMEHSFYMDYGNPGWQNYSVQDYLKSAQGYDGVFLDAIPLSPKEISETGLQRYNDEREFQKALLQYLDYAHSKFLQNGKLLVINGASLINQDPYVVDGVGFWERFLPKTSGILEEAFAEKYHFGGGYQPEERLQEQLAAMDFAGAHKEVYIAFAQSKPFSRTDTTYVFACYLLGQNEYTYFYNNNLGKYRIDDFRRGNELYSDLYNIDLGKPIGGRFVENGLLKRRYEKGLVVVDVLEKSAQINLY